MQTFEIIVIVLFTVTWTLSTFACGVSAGRYYRWPLSRFSDKARGIEPASKVPFWEDQDVDN